MFDLFAMLLSSIASFLFPIFASYKALKTSDPAQLTPWLMYWVVFSICLLVESWFSFILFWIPFYGYIRLFFFLYLILPQSQGARVLYEEKVHPFLEENENSIDDFIASAHDRLRAAGMTYVRRGIEYLKTNILNMPSEEHDTTAPVQPASAAPQSYTQSLLARFSVPTTRWAGTTNTGNEFYNLLANAVSAATSARASADHTGGSSGRAMADSATLVPPHLRGSAERMNFIAAQRERLAIVLSALDREAAQIQTSSETSRSVPPGSFGGAHDFDDNGTTQRPPSGLSQVSGLSKSRSETDFEKVEAESGAEDDANLRRRRRQQHPNSASAGSWMSWGWATGGEAASPGPEED